MKLLASLLGCAVADYACCPYDEFGVVNPGCPLTEKTPWAMDSTNANADPSGVEVHLCKAWEANPGASMEGDEDLDNWGGCGFQRHFSWAVDNVKHGDSVTSAVQATQHCVMGMASCPSSGTVSTLYKKLKTGTTGFHLTGSAATAAPFTAGNTNDVFGQVTLGAICKLFVPVQERAIDSVSIAGVHMNGKTSGTYATQSVFAASICSNDACDNAANGNALGTAYCFSVVNIGEHMINNMPNSNFAVMNANVAGAEAGGHAPITNPGENGVDFSVDFGGSIEPGSEGAGGTTMVEAGASFDVVVHFKSDWCIRHWTLVDMQTAPDVNSGVVDYPLEDDTNVPQHAHKDVADKRIAGTTGICGCCDSNNVRLDDASFSTISAVGCTACSNAAGAQCDDFDSYHTQVSSGMKWPNVGAWAAFYSFVTCADNTLMVYDRLTGLDSTTGATTTTELSRDVVHSMFYNDVRHDWSNAHGGTGKVVVRGNFRQVGSSIVNCGPGTMPDADSKRCTWNWNMLGGTDAEDWFERTSPEAFNAWKSGSAVDRNDDANALTNGAVTGILRSNTFDVAFRSSAAGVTSVAETVALTVDGGANYFAVAAGTHATGDGYLFTITQTCATSAGVKIAADAANAKDAADLGDTTSTNVRDLFPDCYMGDEIHFSLEVTPGSTSTGQQRINAWYSEVTPSFIAA